MINQKNHDDVIEDFLQESYHHEPEHKLLNHYIEYFFRRDEKMRIDVQFRMVEEGLITVSTGNASVVYLTSLGRQIAKEKGYIKWITHRRRLREAEDNKTFWQSKLVKWQVKTFWWLFGISILALIISLLAIFKHKLGLTGI